MLPLPGHPKNSLRATLASLFIVAIPPLAPAENPPPKAHFIEAHSPELATPYLPQPSSHVVDRRNILSIKQRSDLGTLLRNAATNDDISIYVLILRETPAEGVEAYFTALAKQWDTKRLTAFVVCDTDKPRELKAGIHIIPGNVPAEGKLRNNLLTAAKNATLFAHNQRNIADAIEVGAFEILEQYQNILSGQPLTPPGNTTTPAAAAAPPQSHSKSPVDIHSLTKKITPAIIITFLLLALAAASIAIRSHRRRYLFPVPEFRYRLCAPFSGGNSARIDYRLKVRQSPPE